VILLRPGSDSVPLEYFDDQGFYRGISADYVSLLEQRLGIGFQVVRSRSVARKQEFGDVRPLLAPTPEREKIWSFTSPYLELPAYLITRASARDGLTLSDLAGARVAVVVNYAALDYVAAQFPGVLLDPVPDNRTGLRKVSFGLVDGFVSDLPVATYWMEKEGITNLEVASETGFVYRMGMASRRDWPELHHLLEKGLALVTPAEREEIYHRWVHLAPRPGLGRRFIIGAIVFIGAGAFALTGVLLWNRTLQARVARRTEELQILNEANLALARSLDVERVLGTLLDTVGQLVPYDSANVMLLEGDRLMQRAERGYEQRGGRSYLGAFPVQEPFWWEPLEKGSVVIPDTRSEPRWLDLPGCEHVRSWLAVPLRAGGTVMGLFSLDKSEPGFFTSEHVRLAEALAGPAAVAVANARLYDESQRAERALRASEEKFVKAFRSSPVPMTLATFPEGRFVDVNEAFVRASGYGREALGRTTAELGSWPDEGRRRQLLDKLQQSQRVTDEEFNYRTRSGEIRTGLISMELVDLGGAPHVLAASFDITERKRMEAALRASEERFLAFFRLSPIPMSIATLDEGRLVYVNDAYARLTGYRGEELVGKTTVELGIADAETRSEFIRVYVETGTIRNREHSFRTRSGEQRTVLFSADIVEIEGAPHVLLAAVDITDYRRLQEELRQAQKMEAIGQLAGGVAHDFNNMLMAITAHCDVLGLELGGGQPVPAEPIRQAVDDIQQVAGKAANLTRQLLTFSRKQSLQPRALDLNTVVEEWQRLLRRLIGSAVEIRFQPGEGLGRVEGDPGAIEQVLMNLCLNARDAMPEGGVLTIATANEALDLPLRTPHGEVAPGRYVALTVADTGMGMDLATRERIFEPFFTTKAPGKGTGLGLSTVYGIVGQSGGSILVTSEKGAGSTFRILLPRTDGALDAPVERMATVPARGTETILFVEDNDEVQQMAAEYLESVGYTVLTARNAAEAEARADEVGGNTLDLLLTDVELPGASGPLLAKQLAAERPGLKVLFLSGQAHYALERYSVSPADILEKPFPLAVLAERVRVALDRDQPPPPRGSDRKEK
jgi:two-component system, cell cycle sensor histidine kinase and response regulator CckA